jgi:hypothetical protein
VRPRGGQKHEEGRSPVGESPANEDVLGSSADHFITENDTTSPITATIRGVVIRGWMKGARVTGEYTVLDPCPIATLGNVFGMVCFQGTLHLQHRGK